MNPNPRVGFRFLSNEWKMIHYTIVTGITSSSKPDICVITRHGVYAFSQEKLCNFRIYCVTSWNSKKILGIQGKFQEKILIQHELKRKFYWRFEVWRVRKEMLVYFNLRRRWITVNNTVAQWSMLSSVHSQGSWFEYRQILNFFNTFFQNLFYESYTIYPKVSFFMGEKA